MDAEKGMTAGKLLRGPAAGCKITSLTHTLRDDPVIRRNQSAEHEQTPEEVNLKQRRSVRRGNMLLQLICFAALLACGESRSFNSLSEDVSNRNVSFDFVFLMLYFWVCLYVFLK